jgi:hypothetical protein
MATFLVALAAGAAAVAIWADTRFEQLGPSDFRGALIHLGIALCFGWFAVPAAMTEALNAGASPSLVVLGLALPSLVYMSLAALWVIKHAQARLSRR